MDWIVKAFRAVTPFPWFWAIAGLLLLAPLQAADLQEFISQFLQRGLRDMNVQLYYIIVLTLIIVALCWKLVRVQVPRFKITFPNEGDPVITPEKQKNQNGETIQEWQAAYLRLRVEVLSHTTIENCAGYIVGIKRKAENGWVDSNIQDSIQLRWSYTYVPSELNIPHKVVRHLDIIKAQDNNNKLDLPFAWPLRLRSFFDENGTYRFDLVVNGGGVSDSKTLDIEWGGSWDTLKAREV